MSNCVFIIMFLKKQHRISNNIIKQPLSGFLWNSFSKQLGLVYISKLLNKLHCKYFSVKSVSFLRPAIFRNTFERLIIHVRGYRIIDPFPRLSIFYNFLNTTALLFLGITFFWECTCGIFRWFFYRVDLFNINVSVAMASFWYYV